MSTELEDIKQRLKDDVPWRDIGKMRMDALKQLELLEKALCWSIHKTLHMYRMGGIIHIRAGGCGCCSDYIYDGDKSYEPEYEGDKVRDQFDRDFPVEFRELILSLADSGEFDD